MENSGKTGLVLGFHLLVPTHYRGTYFKTEGSNIYLRILHTYIFTFSDKCECLSTSLKTSGLDANAEECGEINRAL